MIFFILFYSFQSSLRHDFSRRGLLSTAAIQSKFCRIDRHLKELPRNIQNSAASIFTTYDLRRVRVVHVRQCKLNELLSRARYFHECLIAELLLHVLGKKKSTRQVFPARKRPEVCLSKNEVRRELLSMALFYTGINSRLRVHTSSRNINRAR